MTSHQEKVNRDWATSQQLIDQHVLPFLSVKLGVTCYSINKDGSEIEAVLDRRASIDALADCNGLVHGIALRAAVGSWSKFTIRWKRSTGLSTEFEKFRKARASNALTPNITVQAYISGNTLSMGVAITPKLYQWVEDNLRNESLVQRRSAYDGNRFLVVYWDRLESCGWFRRWILLFTKGRLFMQIDKEIFEDLNRYSMVSSNE